MSYSSYLKTVPEVGSKEYPAHFYYKFDIIQQLLDDINTAIATNGSDDLAIYLTSIQASIDLILSSLTDELTDVLIDVDVELNSINTILELLFNLETVAFLDLALPGNAIKTDETLTQVIIDNPDSDIFLKYNSTLMSLQWSTSAGVKGGPYEEDVVEFSIPVFSNLAGTELIDTKVIITEDEEMYGHGVYIDAKVGSYTVDETIDKGKVFTFTGTSTMELPSPASVSAKGFQATVINRGTGVVTISCVSGASAIEAKLKTGNAYPILDGQYSAASIIWLDTGSWGVYGDLEYDVP